MDDKEFREALDKLGISQAQFARDTEMGPVTVNRWATGLQRIPGIAQAYVRLRLKVQEFSSDVTPRKPLTLRRRKLKRGDF